MITKEEFTKLIEDYQNWNKRIDEVCEILNSEIWETDWVSYSSKLFDYTLHLLFAENGVDLINDYLFESDAIEITIDNKKYIINNIDTLWDLIKDYRKN